MALIKINGTPLADLGGTLNRPTLQVVKSLTEPDSASFQISGYKPTPNSEVEVWNSAGTVRRFGGVLQMPEGTRFGRGPDFDVDYTCECGGFSHHLQRHLITHRFDAQTAGATIREAVALHDPDIDTDNVQDGPDLPAFAWQDYPLVMIQRLAELTGFYWRVDDAKQLYFEPRGYRRAPADLTDGSLNFADLVISYDAKTIRNAIDLRGGMVPSPATHEDSFNGDGITGNFKLSYEPYSLDRNPLVRDRFSPTSDYHPSSQLWLEFDVTNPSPPNQPDSGKAPIVGTDGYLLVDNFGYEQGACQIVGGPGSWGSVGMLSKEGFARQDDRYYYATFVANDDGEALIGWFDGVGVDETDCLYGLRLETGGALHVQEGGAKVALTGKSYVTGTTYSVRLTVKAAGGVTIDIIGGTYGTWSGKAWTELYDSANGTAPTLYAGVAGNSADLSIYEIRVADPVLGITVLVGGVKQVVGLDNVDTAQVDCLINPQSRLLRFFSDNIPASGSGNVTAEYRRPIPIRVYGKDDAAIAALAALTGETGDKAGYREFRIKDETITSFEEARARIDQELREYANPILTATWSTEVEGYEPGQSIRIAVTNHGEDRDFLITEVHGAHFNGDWWEYQITAGSTLKGLNDYLAKLIQAGRRIAWDQNQPLEFMVAGEDLVAITETIDKLTTTPEVSGDRTVTITEVIDELGFGPTPPYRYDDPNTRWGRATYA